MTKPYRPPRNIQLEAAIGRFVIAWNVLEREIDQTIGVIFRLESDLAWSITANLGTKAKIEMFQSAAHSLIDIIGTDKTKLVDTLVGDTGNLSGKRRNFLFHGIPFVIRASKGKKLHFWGKLHARKGGVRGSVMRLDRAAVDKMSAEVDSVTDRWVTFRNDLASDIDFWNWYEREEGKRTPIYAIDKSD